MFDSALCKHSAVWQSWFSAFFLNINPKKQPRKTRNNPKLILKKPLNEKTLSKKRVKVSYSEVPFLGVAQVVFFFFLVTNRKAPAGLPPEDGEVSGHG